MSYLGLIDRTAVKVATTTATKPPPPPPQEAPRTTLLATKMTTYAQAKPTVQQNVVKPTVTAQPSPETTVTATPQEVEVSSTQDAPSAAEMQTTVQAATKTNWLPWALGAAGLFWFYKKK
jgi:outer membrane biosynthesis protein TonB